MKKISTLSLYLIGILVLGLCSLKSTAQTGCHSLFSFHQSANSLEVNFTDVSSSPNSIISWHWDFGDGQTSTSQNPSHTYAHDGTYQVCLTTHDNHGCSNTYCHTVTVNSVPPGNCHTLFGFHQTANTLTVNFNDMSSSPGTIISWLWNFGDGHTSTLQNPDHTYAHDGTYQVCLTIHDNHGCSGTYCHAVTLNPHEPVCHASFAYHGDSTEIHFTNTSTGTTAHTTYLWNFGDGTTSTDENPHHVYAHSGHYTVCLYITDQTTGCSSHTCHTIEVHHTGHHHHGLVAISNFVAIAGNDVQLNSEQYIVNYPNPAISSTTIQYELAEDTWVKMELFDIMGNRINQFVNEFQVGGPQSRSLNTTNLKAGLYFVKVIVNDESFMKRISVAK